MPKFLFYPVLCLFGATPVAADVTAEYRFGYKNQGVEMRCTIEVAPNGNARIQGQHTNSYALLRGGSFYFMKRVPDGLISITDTAMEIALNRNSSRPNVKNRIKTKKWKALGVIKINGRSGVAWDYLLVPSRADQLRFRPLVLGDDERLAPLGPVFEALEGSPSLAVSACAYRPGIVGLPRQITQKGPLKIGPLVLDRVSFKPIPEERFDLPSEPIPTEKWLAMTRPFAPAPALESNQDGEPRRRR